jgi:hypothetical protein
MNEVKKFLQLVQTLIATLVFSFFLLSQSAIAAMGMPEIDSIFESVPITGGGFTIDLTVPIKEKIRIASAVVSLPDGETGTIDEIAITGSDGKIFGCQNIKVQNGTDLIKSCGGSAYLVPGDTKYQAKGSNFQPSPDIKFGVELSP